jgi:putative acetyltransferase
VKKLAIRLENEGDREAVSEINRAAFGQPDEADLIGRLRSENLVVVSLVADMDGRMVGHILFSRLEVTCPR